MNQPAPLGPQDAVSDVPVSPPIPSDPISHANGEKEREPLGPRESVPLVELKERAEFEPEVEGWLEHLEQAGEITLPEPLKDDTGATLLADAGAQVVDDKIVLPLSHEELEKGLHQKAYSSARWLAEWSMRIIKMFGEQVRYRDE